MCQLLGMNCNVPTDMNFSMDGFYLRAGQTDQHCDGCGVAFFQGKSVRIFRDNLSALTSPIAQSLRKYDLKTLNGIAHIRKATQGEINLENTHPFLRELWGENWVFAHNGNLTALPHLEENNIIFYEPIGTTDSEAAFCFMANQLKNKFKTKPTEKQLFESIKEISQTLQNNGTFNFLLSNGEVMFAFCTTDLYYITRHAPFGEVLRVDDDAVIDFRPYTTERDKVTIIATRPLTKNENWVKMEKGELCLFKQGERIK
ncbi:class II glutamine amidotransferase [Actinobacillus delphinicola]|uniref:class II glutamine amidotransferase n=1 Tax=Actinobacillus delphinicola TaxID=51161 RepID=UPI0024433E94|nr:class II glutamine amidotransferase [Actinobacillus delphinicola]MDG6897586.1 class II glutamine amidotransferase [Actinobacillus delphinicola]